MSTAPVHKWLSVRLEILAMYLRAADEVVSALASKMTEARGWLEGRRREGLNDKAIDEGWIQVVEGMEAERLRTLNELLKFRQVASQVKDDLPRGPLIVKVLSKIMRSVEDFCPQAYTQQFISSQRPRIHRTLTSAAKRLRVMADDVDSVYVPQKNPRGPQKKPIGAKVADWININGPGSSSRHIGREIGVSHESVRKTAAYQNSKALPAPQIDPDADLEEIVVDEHNDIADQLAADEYLKQINKLASPEMLDKIGLELPDLGSEALKVILASVRDDADDRRPKRASRRQKV